MKNRRLDPICVCFSIRKLTSLLVLSVCHLHLRGLREHAELSPQGFRKRPSISAAHILPSLGGTHLLRDPSSPLPVKR